jgi:hypothetical protein
MLRNRNRVNSGGNGQFRSYTYSIYRANLRALECGVAGAFVWYKNSLRAISKFTGMALIWVPFVRFLFSTLKAIRTLPTLALIPGLLFTAALAFAQGGPPYYTNDPGTPGPLNWEINLGYMPFFYSNQSVSHTPDLDINFGLGERIQLSYENAWLRVQYPSSPAKYGLGQSNAGVKWRFFDAGPSGLSISVFPQVFVNNPNNSVRRGITPASDTFLLPFEFARKIGPVGVDCEVGYQFVHHGQNGFLAGLVVGHDFTPKLEMDVEFYSQGPFHISDTQPTIGVGGRYRIHSPIVLLLMAGRSLEATGPNQSYFIGYFGLQFLLPPKSYKSDRPTP